VLADGQVVGAVRDEFELAGGEALQTEVAVGR